MPLIQVIMDTSVWNKHVIIHGKPCVTKVIASFWYGKPLLPCILKNPTICCTPFPAREKIAELQVEFTGGKKVL